MIPDKKWVTMPLGERLKAVNIDIMNHTDFAQLAGVVCTGAVHVVDHVPTAGTDGLHVWYGKQFNESLNQKQLRYVALHENFHKGLKHCLLYRDVVKQYPQASNAAQDYVINLLIEETDKDFVQRPCKILINKKYSGWGWIEVLKDLLKNPPKGGGGKGTPQQGEGQGKPGGGMPQPDDGQDTEGYGGEGEQFDEHMEGAEGSEGKKVEQDMTEAWEQGRILSDKLKQKRGTGQGKQSIAAQTQQRSTDWRGPLRDFIQAHCDGDEESRFSPLNKRLRPMGIIAPSHFSETIGELGVYCDTSGSMHGVYPTVFGEVAHICKSVKPELVRILWWSDGVESEQVFTPDQYDGIARLIKPKGRGGTRLSSVAEYIAEKKYKPVAHIILTDGYIETEYDLPNGPILWGIVDNPAFTPRAGKKLDINSITL